MQRLCPYKIIMLRCCRRTITPWAISSEGLARHLPHAIWRSLGCRPASYPRQPGAAAAGPAIRARPHLGLHRWPAYRLGRRRAARRAGFCAASRCRRLPGNRTEWATAAAPGIVARSELGTVVLDLDGDGDERTGWVIFYFHIGTEGRAAGRPRTADRGPDWASFLRRRAHNGHTYPYRPKIQW